MGIRSWMGLAVAALAAWHGGGAQAAAKGCLTDCRPRIGIISAFGAEADLLVAQTRSRRTHLVNGNAFTTGVLRGNPVVIVLSGVSTVNSVMVTQLMLNHFRVERLVMSGIAGGLNPALNVGDVTVPDRWLLAMEVYWNQDSSVPKPCGKPTEVGCLGLKLAVGPDGQPFPPPFELPTAQGKAPTGLFMRENFIANARTGPKGKFMFEYPVDPQMLAVARGLQPKLEQCGTARPEGQPSAPPRCVKHQPRYVVGGTGVTGTAFLANAHYREYLFTHLKANTFEMETAGLAHVAHANGVPYIAFRSLSDLAGAEEFNEEVVALFSSGLAEANEAAVTLAFLEAWRKRQAPPAAAKERP